ncbi:hypothetical protein [Ralstonia insidiosa]|uniref:hypothetical protein n=1 Tax=Ralstonia insidiosa TaxID=190721 RepID=UPI000CED9EB0|nr:hypothetical protein [Ralstonia insidiosa]
MVEVGVRETVVNQQAMSEMVRMQPSKCLRHKEVLVADLDTEINRVRDALSWPFACREESFDAYMARVKALDRLEAPTDAISIASQERLRSVLADDYPATDECQDATFRAYMLSSCVFLARAEEARKQANHEEAWFFVSGARECLGRSDGYYEVTSHESMKKSRASQGGRKKAQNLEKRVQQLYIQFLRTLMPPGGWRSPQEAIATVSAATASVLEIFGNPIEDAYAKLAEMLASNSDVKAAFNAALRK